MNRGTGDNRGSSDKFSNQGIHGTNVTVAAIQRCGYSSVTNEVYTVCVGEVWFTINQSVVISLRLVRALVTVEYATRRVPHFDLVS